MTSSHKAATTAAVSPPVAAPTSLLPLSPPDATLQYSIDFLDDSRDGGGAEGAEPGGENRASPSATIFSPFQASPASPPAPASDGDFIEPIALGFHSLRRKALPLETQVQAKLDAFSRFSLHLHRLLSPKYTTRKKRTGLGKIRKMHSEAEAEIETLLDSLESVNAKLQQAANKADPSQLHLLGRSAELLASSWHVFNKYKQSIRQGMTRLELLAHPNGELEAGDKHKHESNVQTLLREQGSLESSLNLTNEALSAAQETSLSLSRQRQNLQNSSGTLHALDGKFPALGILISKIERYKNRDSTVLAFLIASLMAFTFFYWLNKGNGYGGDSGMLGRRPVACSPAC